ncbi:hypothetical protein HK101_006758 [Irineochytrium annulatum]|nr:hypothetical protein HK101_006758 [Irineochytrium annulatum]
MVALNAGIKRCGGGLNDTTRTVVKFVQSYNLDERLAYGFIGGVVCWVIAVAVGVLYLLMPFKTLEFVKSELYSWDEEDANLPLRRLTWTLERKPERVSCCCSVKQSEWRIKVYQSDGGGPGDNEEFEEYLPLYNPPAAAAVVGEESVNGEAIATRVGSIRSLRSTGTVVTVSKPPSYLERQ